MNNYKINIQFGTLDLNSILTKILNKELKNYLRTICKNKKYRLSSNHTNLSTKLEEDNNGR